MFKSRGEKAYATLHLEGGSEFLPPLDFCKVNTLYTSSPSLPYILETLSLPPQPHFLYVHCVLYVHKLQERMHTIPLFLRSSHFMSFVRGSKR